MSDLLMVLQEAADLPGDRLAPGGGLLEPDLSELSAEELEVLQAALEAKSD